MKKIALTFFAISGIGVLAAGYFSLSWLFMSSKPLIMISLLFYYFVSAESENRSRALMLAIVFSFAGDVLLLKEEYFIAGLIAFLISHALYIFAYRQFRYEEFQDPLSGLQRVRLAFPIVLAGTGLVVILFPVLGDLRIPVTIYAFVLVLMVISALFRLGNTTSSSFWMVFSGAVIFMISDSILAINKFIEPVLFSGMLIMSTYMMAQFLIIHGLLKHPH